MIACQKHVVWVMRSCQRVVHPDEPVLGCYRQKVIQGLFNFITCNVTQVRTAYETDLAEVCAPRQANVGLLAYSPLAGGALSGKYTDKAPEGARFTIFPGLPSDSTGQSYRKNISVVPCNGRESVRRRGHGQTIL